MTNFHLIWEKWLEKQNPEHRGLVDYYTNLLLNADHRIYPRVSYGASFLYRFGPLGYFNTDNEGLYFAFYWGKLLLDSSGAEILNRDDRKMVKLVYFNSSEDDESFIATFLQLIEEAILIDEDKYGKKSK